MASNLCILLSRSYREMGKLHRMLKPKESERKVRCSKGRLLEEALVIKSGKIFRKERHKFFISVETMSLMFKVHSP